jgi:hypothetical protein
LDFTCLAADKDFGMLIEKYAKSKMKNPVNPVILSNKFLIPYEFSYKMYIVL